VQNWLLITILSVSSIFFRYQMLSLVIAIPIYLVFFNKPKLDYPKILLSFLFFAFTLIPYLALKHYNSTHGVDLLSNIKPSFNFQYLDILYSILHLLPSILMTRNALILGLNDSLVLIISIALSAVSLFCFIIYWKSIKKYALPLLIFLSLTIVQLIIVGQSTRFNALLEARYYLFLNPLLMIVIFCTINSFSINHNRFQTNLHNSTNILIPFGMISLAFCCFLTYRLILQSRAYYHIKSDYTKNIDNVVKTNKLYSSDIVIFTGMNDPNNLSSMLLQDNIYPIFRRLNILNDDKLIISGKEKILLIVHDSINWENQINKGITFQLLDNKFNHCIYLLKL
jgi:hypothetical protein